ncbi:MAG: FAD-dependent oxidoreductase, partial [Myxococcota bacterium]|nr:FAD-dependent oxidoreductase [Myxococcota bacterium]
EWMWYYCCAPPIQAVHVWSLLDEDFKRGLQLSDWIAAAYGRLAMGGSHSVECAGKSDSELVDQARAVLAVMLGVRGFPAAVSVSRWPRAIPQYRPGHGRRIAALREGLAGWRGLHLAGNYLDGVGLEPTIVSGSLAARRVLAERH